MLLRPIHLAALIGVNFIFAGAYIAGKIGVTHFPPFFFTALRFLLLFIVLLPFFKWIDFKADEGDAIKASKTSKAFWQFCLAMGIGVYCPMYLALSIANGVSGIFIATQFSVPIAALLGIWLLKTNITSAVWLGIILAFVGVMIVGYSEALLGQGLAFTIILVSAFFYAYANVTNKKLTGKIKILNLNAWMALLSILPMLVLSFIFEEGQWQSIVEADWTSWFVLMYSALVVSLVGHTGMFTLLRLYPVGLIMPYYVLTPIFGIVLGFIFFDEEVTYQFYIGAFLALVGVYIVNTKLKIK